MHVLEIDALTKEYGEFTAVRDLNLTIEKGSIFGFLGLNGAGKTTTIRMITGLSKPTAGHITVCGVPVRFGGCAANKHIGYLPDVPEFYGWLRPDEALALCGRLGGLSAPQIGSRSAGLLRLVGLEGVRRRVGGFSRGMKQRLGIAQALMNEPDLLILDEPTSALDPVGRKEILDIIGSLRGRVTVLFSTHILSDVQRVCDTIGILHHGSLALSGSLKEIEQKYAGRSVRLEVNAGDGMDTLRARLEQLPCVRETHVEAAGSLRIVCRDLESLGAAVCPLLGELKLPLRGFEPLESNLEDVFIDVIQKVGKEAGGRA